jgi:hypothetical protein
MIPKFTYNKLGFQILLLQTSSCSARPQSRACRIKRNIRKIQLEFKIQPFPTILLYSHFIYNWTKPVVSLQITCMSAHLARKLHTSHSSCNIDVKWILASPYEEQVSFNVQLICTSLDRVETEKRKLLPGWMIKQISRSPTTIDKGINFLFRTVCSKSSYFALQQSTNIRCNHRGASDLLRIQETKGCHSSTHLPVSCVLLQGI